MRQLVLVRHAKAEQGRRDMDRRLTARGTRDSRALGSWLAARGVLPDHVIVSPAVRAAATWEAAAAQLPAPPPADTDDRVYANTVEDLLGLVRDVPASVRTLAVVGHNPSMQELAVQLAGDDTARGAADLAETYPTCAVAVFAVDGDWADVGPSTASLSAFEVPRDDG